MTIVHYIRWSYYDLYSLIEHSTRSSVYWTMSNGHVSNCSSNTAQWLIWYIPNVCVNYDVWSGPPIKFFDTFKLVKVYPSNEIKFAFKLIHTMMLNRTLWLFMQLVKHDLLVYLKRLRDVHTTRTCKSYRILTVYWCSLIEQMHVQCELIRDTVHSACVIFIGIRYQREVSFMSYDIIRA